MRTCSVQSVAKVDGVKLTRLWGGSPPISEMVKDVNGCGG